MYQRIRELTNDWFRSDLSDREHFVDIEGVISNRVPMTIGVPQGSTLCHLTTLVMEPSCPFQMTPHFLDPTQISVNSIVEQTSI